MTDAISVGELTRCVRGVIEAEDLFSDVRVRGEISNLVMHSSGHIYFSLKDESAIVRAVIWRGDARNVRRITNGMNVIARGRVTVYERQGQYQLVVNEVAPDGLGALYVAYEKLKARLTDEGLFDEATKKPLPRFPKRVAIVTSPTGAAIRDMITVARRRMPGIDLLIIPALVQGPGADASVVDALRLADSSDADAIVVGRGGGSIEDLWTFNEEAVVRTISACEKPVVSAVGHETDYTLADFAADLRAPTPSAAMEIVVPDSQALLAGIEGLVYTLKSSMDTAIADKRRLLDVFCGAQCFRYPRRMIEDRWQVLDTLVTRATTSMRTIISRNENRLGEAAAKLDGVSPLATLARGYSVTIRASDNAVIKSAGDVGTGEIIESILADGRIRSQVIREKE